MTVGSARFEMGLSNPVRLRRALKVTTKQRWWAGFFGAIGGGVGAYFGFRFISKARVKGMFPPTDDNLTIDQLRAALPANGQYLTDVLWQVYNETGLDPLLMAGLLARESNFGDALSPKGAGGTGDAGHGRGLGQIDDRSFASWLASNDWKDPYTNIRKSADILIAKAAYLKGHGISGDKLVNAALAAYNAGEGRVLETLNKGGNPDSLTTGGDYSRWVLAKRDTYQSKAGLA